MVGKINMKQLRRQEERAKKKDRTREMEEQRCTEYSEARSKGGSEVNTAGISRKGKGKEEKKQDRKEEDQSQTISWHGELEINSISFPEDLVTAYEALKIKGSTSDEVIVEYLLDKVEHLSFAGSPEAVEASSLELGCVLMVLCDRTTCFDSAYFILIQFIYAVEANKYLSRLRLPLPGNLSSEFPTPSILPNFARFPDARSIREKLSQILIVRQYPMPMKPLFGGEEGATYVKYDPEDKEAVFRTIRDARARLDAEDDTEVELIDARAKLEREVQGLKKENDALLLEKEIATTNPSLAQMKKRSTGEIRKSSDLLEVKVQLEEACKEVTVKTAAIASLKEREERTNVESKKMRERSREQLSEKDEVIKGLRESNSKLTQDIATTSAQTTSDDKLKTELADVKLQLREAQAKSTSFSESKDCINLQSKVSKELAVEVARLKGSSSFSTSTPSTSDKKDFVISTLSKKVIDLSKQVKEQNEQLAEMLSVMSKADDD